MTIKHFLLIHTVMIPHPHPSYDSPPPLPHSFNPTLPFNGSHVTTILCLPWSLCKRGALEHFNITPNDRVIRNPRTIWPGRGEGGNLNNTKSKVLIYKYKYLSDQTILHQQHIPGTSTVSFLQFSVHKIE